MRGVVSLNKIYTYCSRREKSGLRRGWWPEGTNLEPKEDVLDTLAKFDLHQYFQSVETAPEDEAVLLAPCR